MNKTLLTAVLLLGCIATSQAQSTFGNELTIPRRSPIQLGQPVGILVGITNRPPDMEIFNFPPCSNGFNPGMVAYSQITFHGNNIVIDSFEVTPVPEPSSGLMLLAGLVLLAATIPCPRVPSASASSIE